MIGQILDFISHNLLNKKINIPYGAKLYSTARILNNSKVKNAISIGEYSHIRGELMTFGHGGLIRVGQYCYVGHDTRIWSAKSIIIGDRVLISHNVNIFDNTTHPLSARLRHQQFKDIISKGHPSKIDLHEQPVVIHDDVLISCMSIILSGVSIGTGAIVGAGSVVTRDVPPWTIVAGNPAKIIRQLSEDER